VVDKAEFGLHYNMRDLIVMLVLIININNQWIQDCHAHDYSGWVIFLSKFISHV
jgi:hypothetical protein